MPRGFWHPNLKPVVRTLAERFWPKVDKAGECWLWTGARNNQGYGHAAPGDKSLPKMIGAHRAAWILTYGPIPKGLWVLHKCDNPPCVRPDHLYLGTVKENVRDCVERGRLRPGRPGRCELHHFSKLTNAQVAEMRERRAAGASQRVLAGIYGVNQSEISRILNGRRRGVA